VKKVFLFVLEMNQVKSIS